MKKKKKKKKTLVTHIRSEQKWCCLNNMFYQIELQKATQILRKKPFQLQSQSVCSNAKYQTFKCQMLKCSQRSRKYCANHNAIWGGLDWHSACGPHGNSLNTKYKCWLSSARFAKHFAFQQSEWPQVRYCNTCGGHGMILAPSIIVSMAVNRLQMYFVRSP